jgi:proton-dependent oligopeptide transporter, POT family
LNQATSGAAVSPRVAAETGISGRHPKGLYYLAFTETWERFSFYGMVGLLSLYMVDRLLLPGHAEHVAGLARLRAALESLAGPLSPQAFASQIFGLYSAFVYFTPVLGGMIADRWLGQRTAVVSGALAMAAGYLALTYDGTFLVALLLLIVGSGLLKGNIAAQVGALYPLDAEARRARGYVIFSTGVNVGAIAGPLVCGWLAQAHGWHSGFGVAAVCMLLGLATYLYGYRCLPARVQRERGPTTRLTGAEWRVIATLITVMLITVFQSVAYLQVFDVAPIWIERQVAPGIAGFKVPVPWYSAINALFSILCVPLLFWIWRRQAARGREPDDLARIGTGAWLTAASNLILVAALLGSSGPRISPLWPLLYSVGLGIAFMYYWPTLLALVSQAAPARVSATLVSGAYLTLFLSNLLIGWIGGLYERMTPASFWALHAAIAAAGGVIVLVFGRYLRRVLRLA